jgi:hypothetical protein
MRTFAERSLAEAKRMNRTVTLTLDNNSIVATYEKDGEDGKEEVVKQPFSDGFVTPSNKEGIQPTGEPSSFLDFGNRAISLQSIGFSGVIEEGSFVACGGKDYCGGVIKRKNKNSFEAFIRKGKNAEWRKI